MLIGFAEATLYRTSALYRGGAHAGGAAAPGAVRPQLIDIGGLLEAACIGGCTAADVVHGHNEAAYRACVRDCQETF